MRVAEVNQGRLRKASKVAGLKQIPLCAMSKDLVHHQHYVSDIQPNKNATHATTASCISQPQGLN